MVKTCLKPYIEFRGEIPEMDGCIINVNRLIIPSTLWQGMLERSHASRQRINACLRRAQNSVYCRIYQLILKELYRILFSVPIIYKIELKMLQRMPKRP